MENDRLPEQSKESLHDIHTKASLDIINNLKKEKSDNSQKIQEFKVLGSTNKQTNEKNNETKKLELYTKVTKEDLQKLCDQLSTFNSRIKTARDVIRLRDELPFILQNKLEEEAGELECLFKELESAVSNVETIQNQRMALGKEKICFNNQISKLKAEAVQEMEVIVSVYDSNMMDKWENIKKTNSTQEVESFLHNVQGKLEAMKNLQTLATQKLTDLKKQEQNSNDCTKKDKKSTDVEERDDSQSRNCRSASILANPSQLSLSFLLDSDPEDMLDEAGMNGVLYNLVCEQVLNLPSWTQSTQSYTSNSMDID